MPTVDVTASEITVSRSGFTVLARLHDRLSRLHNEDVTLDLTRLRWIDAQLGAALLIIVEHARLNGNHIALVSARPEVMQILRRNGTLKSRRDDDSGTTVRVTKFASTEEIEFARFSRRSLDHLRISRLAPLLQRSFFEGVDELFSNSALHAKSQTEIFVCGQYFPKKRILSFLVADGGRGIEGSLASSGRIFTSPVSAITWAMHPKNSSRVGDVPGGLGLSILRDFIKKNEGRLVMCSHRGYWEESAGIISACSLRTYFPGTVSVIEINTANTGAMQNEPLISADEIW